MRRSLNHDQVIQDLRVTEAFLQGMVCATKRRNRYLFEEVSDKVREIRHYLIEQQDIRDTFSKEPS